MPCDVKIEQASNHLLVLRIVQALKLAPLASRCAKQTVDPLSSPPFGWLVIPFLTVMVCAAKAAAGKQAGCGEEHNEPGEPAAGVAMAGSLHLAWSSCILVSSAGPRSTRLSQCRSSLLCF